MRRTPLRFSSIPMIVALGLATGMLGGCAEEQLPPEPFPGASRLRMEDPIGYAKKLKGVQDEQAKPKLSAKEQKANEIREKAEMSDPRSAARLKAIKEQEGQSK